MITSFEMKKTGVCYNLIGKKYKHGKLIQRKVYKEVYCEVIVPANMET